MGCLHICSASYVDSHGNFNLESVWQDSGSSKNGFDFCGRAASLVELEPFYKTFGKKALADYFKCTEKDKMLIMPLLFFLFFLPFLPPDAQQAPLPPSPSLMPPLPPTLHLAPAIDRWHLPPLPSSRSAANTSAPSSRSAAAPPAPPPPPPAPLRLCWHLRHLLLPPIRPPPLASVASPSSSALAPIVARHRRPPAPPRRASYAEQWSDVARRRSARRDLRSRHPWGAKVAGNLEELYGARRSLVSWLHLTSGSRKRL